MYIYLIIYLIRKILLVHFFADLEKFLLSKTSTTSIQFCYLSFETTIFFKVRSNLTIDVVVNLCHKRVNLGVRKLVRLGDKLVDWNEQFRLLLFSRSAEGHASSPQWSSLVNTINFNTNEAGLAQQVQLD